MTHFQIITKLIGATSPIGESNEDARRLDNTSELGELTLQLVERLIELTKNNDYHQASIKKIAFVAGGYLAIIDEKIKESELLPV